MNADRVKKAGLKAGEKKSVPTPRTNQSKTKQMKAALKSKFSAELCFV